MAERRTDLAMEARELLGEGESCPGVVCREGEREGFSLTTVEVTSPQGAQALGKPQGTYHTLDLSGVGRREEGAFGRAARALADLIAPLLPDGKAPVRVVGLGNRAITPDAVGPKAADRTLVTRHLIGMAPEHFGDFRSVAAVAAGVLGSTGVESGEIARAVADRIAPGAIIAIDALCARRVERLCATVQVCDVGIAPGSGVGNHRFALDKESMGVPVIAVGVPTVIEGATLCADMLEELGVAEPERRSQLPGGTLMVTPRDIDQRVEDMAKVIGYGVSLALQPGLTVEELEMLVE